MSLVSNPRPGPDPEPGASHDATGSGAADSANSTEVTAGFYIPVFASRRFPGKSSVNGGCSMNSSVMFEYWREDYCRLCIGCVQAIF